MGIEELKIIAGLLVNLIIVVVTAFFGVLGYMAINFKTIENTQMGLSVIAILMAMLSIVILSLLLRSCLIKMRKFK